MSRFLLYGRTGRPQGPVWAGAKGLAPDTRIVQPVAVRYTDCPTPAHETQYYHLKYKAYTYLYVILYMFKYSL